MDQSSSSSSSSSVAAAAALNIPNVIVSSPPFVFYRLSSVGKALLSTIDTMVQEGIIDGRAAAEILVLLLSSSSSLLLSSSSSLRKTMISLLLKYYKKNYITLIMTMKKEGRIQQR